ncbi:MAG: hypothetical protein H8E20_10050 [Verrucomicrobia bacterium]|nr:hypothetical protein [Verrucomicrobiota bacterium]
MIRLVCLVAVALATVGVRAEKFSAGGIAFEGPKGWQTQKPSSSMRKAQFAIKGKDGKAAEVVFFHFGPGAAGGVKANVQRWLGQFKEPADKLKAKISDETIDGMKVTYVTAEGTFMKGPPFGGTKVPVPNSGLLGAIVDGKQGAVFIKATGPKAIVKSAEKDLKAMISKALKKK